VKARYETKKQECTRGETAPGPTRGEGWSPRLGRVKRGTTENELTRFGVGRGGKVGDSRFRGEGRKECRGKPDKEETIGRRTPAVEDT